MKKGFGCFAVEHVEIVFLNHCACILKQKEQTQQTEGL